MPYPRIVKSFGEKCTLNVLYHQGIGYTINYMILIAGEIVDNRDLTYSFIETEEEALKAAEEWAKEFDENVYDCYKNYEPLNPKCWECVYLKTCKKKENENEL